MASWAEFAAAQPEMAELGRRQLALFGLAYLATVRADGAPRVHPVCPFIVEGRLFVATPPTSPKRLDLLRDRRYVLHMLPGKHDEEFRVRGRASLIATGAERARIIAAAPVAGRQPDGRDLNVSDDDWIFEYDIEEAATAFWEDVGQPDTRAIRKRWRPDRRPAVAGQ